MVEPVTKMSGGYPYFIQFICREVVDVILQAKQVGESITEIPISGIIRKLDADFFAGRWARATDRQRDLLIVIAHLETCDGEFTVQEVVEKSKKPPRSLREMAAEAEVVEKSKQAPEKSFSASQVSQMLSTLGDKGLIYKNRHGKYSFAVPLLGKFILRQQQQWTAEKETG